ncbi:MAG: hypothetical protein AAF528_09955 [Cyanobacteria bacterium P01_C01_bin.121]
MPSLSKLEKHSRLILGCGMIALGAVWLLKLLWPILLILLLAGLMAGTYVFLQRQQQAMLAQQRREDRLARKFYELLDYRQGRISSLEFAMHTRIGGREAQRYLHVQAQAFGGFFERTGNNDVIYIFNPAVIYSYAPQRPVTPVDLTQAYAEQQLQAEHARRSHAAWAQARQLRALHQLAQASPASGVDTKSLSPAADGTLPTIRGRATRTENIQTIDVSAVNE